MGRNTDTMPGNSWPMTSARRMPSPRTATSWEVMPPLATTQAGCADRAAWTTSTTARGDVAGNGQAVVGVAAAQQGTAGEQQHIGGGQSLGDLLADGGDMSVALFGVEQGGHVQLGLDQATTFLRLGDLAAGQADMRPDDNEPVAAGTAGRPDLCRGERALRFEPGQRPGERWATAVYERLAALLRLERAEHDDLQVGVVGGVDHDERAAGDPAEDFGDPVGSALADVGQRDGVDLVRGDRARCSSRRRIPAGWTRCSRRWRPWRTRCHRPEPVLRPRWPSGCHRR